jgi:hypothetical protein
VTRFLAAYRRLTPNRRLRNIQGPGEITFELVWHTDPPRLDAVLRMTPNGLRQDGGITHSSASFEYWNVDVYADYPEKIDQFVTLHHFALDGWEVVPA